MPIMNINIIIKSIIGNIINKLNPKNKTSKIMLMIIIDTTIKATIGRMINKLNKIKIITKAIILIIIIMTIGNTIKIINPKNNIAKIIIIILTGMTIKTKNNIAKIIIIILTGTTTKIKNKIAKMIKIITINIKIKNNIIKIIRIGIPTMRKRRANTIINKGKNPAKKTKAINIGKIIIYISLNFFIYLIIIIFDIPQKIITFCDICLDNQTFFFLLHRRF